MMFPTPQSPPPRRPAKTAVSVTTEEGLTLVCNPEPFATGAEGRLFLSRDGTRVVKLYTHPASWRETALRAIIRRRSTIMGRQKPYWSHLLCWPEALVTAPELGVVMPLAPQNLRPFAHLLLPKYRQVIAKQEGAAALGTWDAHIGLLVKLVRAVNQLHHHEVCHSDLSANNVLVDPIQGQALLIDCDGLVAAGSRVLRPTVLGTLEYMAPELVQGMGQPRPPQPTIASDLHALAVLIYRGLLFRHPLRGSAVHATDPDEDDRLTFGANALYIEHPTDPRNHPTKHFITSGILGGEIPDLFRRAFVEGLHTPALRPTAAQWEAALVRLHEQTVRCRNPQCEAKAFVFGYGRTSAWDCPWCGRMMDSPRRIPLLLHYKPSAEPGRMVLDFSVVGWHQRALYAWHIDLNHLPGPTSDIHPQATMNWQAVSDTWQLTNVAIGEGHVTDGNGTQLLPPGTSIVLTNGMKMFCGSGDALASFSCKCINSDGVAASQLDAAPQTEKNRKEGSIRMWRFASAALPRGP